MPEKVQQAIAVRRAFEIEVKSFSGEGQAELAVGRHGDGRKRLKRKKDEQISTVVFSEPSSQVPMPNAAALPMLAGIPSMTIPMAMPLAAQMASAQMPIPPPMGQHPLQGAPMMMRHQGLILPQQGMLQHQAGNMPPGGPMMGFIPRERFPRPGG